MTIRKFWGYHLTFLLILVLHCSDNPTEPVGAILDQSFLLSIGQSTRIDSEPLEVVFLRVISDTRCPNAGECHYGDIAEISVRLALDKNPPVRAVLRILSNPGPADIEALAIDTLGYRLRLLSLIGEAGQTTGSTNPVAEVQISRVDSQQGHPPDTLLTGDRALEQVLRLAVEIDTTFIVSDTLFMSIVYYGGCGRHFFDLHMLPTSLLEGEPFHANLHLRHTSGADACSDRIKQELRFSLTPLKALMAAQIGDSAFVQVNVVTYSGDAGSRTSILYYGTPPQLVNHPPTIGSIDDQTVEVSQILKLRVSASDPDLTFPALTTGALPDNAVFVDFGSGQGELTYSPLAPAIGNHKVEIIASDGIEADTEHISIEVLPENFAPIMTAPDSAVVAEGDSLFLIVSATDPNGTIPGIRLSRPLENMKVVVHHDGTATLEFRPGYFQAGTHAIYIIASDMALEDSSLFVVRVPNTNRVPVMTAPEIVNSWFDYEVTANLSAKDPDSEAISISAVNLPANVTLTDNGNGTARLKAKPDATQFGVYDIPVVASDGDLADTATIELAVLGAYPGPRFIPIPPQSVMEGDTLRVLLETENWNSTSRIHYIGNRYRYKGRIQLDGQLDGKALFTYVPRFLNPDLDTFSFIAVDRSWADTLVLIVNVFDAPNQAPRIVEQSRYQGSVVGQTFELEIRAFDPDSSGPVTITAHGLPSGASLISTGTNVSKFLFTPGQSAIGTYLLSFEAHDFIDPTLFTTFDMSLSVHEFQNNQGRIIPLEIGRYWVYEYENWGTCGDPDSPDSELEMKLYTPASFFRIDSVEVIDSTRVDGKLLWTLTTSGWPLARYAREDGDTVTFIPSYVRYFPIEQQTPIPNGYAKPISSVVPTGAYENAFFYFGSGGGWSNYNSLGVTVVPGIGLVKWAHHHDSFSISNCDHQGCCTVNQTYLLIRTGRR